MSRSWWIALALVAGCSRSGLYGFADASGGEGGTLAGSGGAAGSGALGGTGGSAGSILHECDSSADCSALDPCARSECRVTGEGASSRRRCFAVPLDCDDGDPCTLDRCDPSSSRCENVAPADRDGDGYRGEPPPGAAEGCGGPDCDDDDPLVFPGAAEICDGRDNDCDGGIDEGFDFTNTVSVPLLVSAPEIERAQRGGLAWGGERYALTYASSGGRRQNYFKMLDLFGSPVTDDVFISQINADTYAGPISFSGDGFLTVWSDARQAGNYEVYATRFGADGQKLQADLRLTDAPDFSIKPAVVWTGSQYVVAWADFRDDDLGGVPRIYGRRFSAQGLPIGDEIPLTPSGLHAEYPALAVGELSLGLAYVIVHPGAAPSAGFISLSFELDDGSAGVEIPNSSYVDDPSVTYAGGRFIIAWNQAFPDLTPGAELHAAYVDDAGDVEIGRPISAGHSFVRSHSLVSLGDRAFVVFAGAGPDGIYDLFATMLDAGLQAGPAERLTSSPAKSFQPLAALGSAGLVGIVYDEDDDRPPTSRRVYSLTVGCAEP